MRDCFIDNTERGGGPAGRLLAEQQQLERGYVCIYKAGESIIHGIGARPPVWQMTSGALARLVVWRRHNNRHLRLINTPSSVKENEKKTSYISETEGICIIQDVSSILINGTLYVIQVPFVVYRPSIFSHNNKMFFRHPIDPYHLRWWGRCCVT